MAAARQKRYPTALVSKNCFYLIIVATVGLLALARQKRYATGLASRNCFHRITVILKSYQS